MRGLFTKPVFSPPIGLLLRSSYGFCVALYNPNSVVVTLCLRELFQSNEIQTVMSKSLQTSPPSPPTQRKYHSSSESDGIES